MRVSKQQQLSKYNNFIIELHSILKVTDHVKISNLTKKHRVSTLLALRLADLRIIEKVKRSSYRWIAGDPSMIMTHRLIKSVRAHHKGITTAEPHQLEMSSLIKPDASTKRGLLKALSQPVPSAEILNSKPVDPYIKKETPASKMKISFAWGLFKFEK